MGLKLIVWLPLDIQSFRLSGPCPVHALMQLNLNSTQLPFLSILLSLSVFALLPLSYLPYSSLSILPSLSPTAACVNFRIFCRAGSSWHEMGLAKETIFTTKSLPFCRSAQLLPTFHPENACSCSVPVFFLPQLHQELHPLLHHTH